MDSPIELPGLEVRLDRLVYRFDPENAPADRPHVFIYFITIQNGSDLNVTILGRRWVIENEDGERVVVEGEGVVGEMPLIPPGGTFSYNSFHVTHCNGTVRGSYHGLDDEGRHVFVRVPPFPLLIPPPGAKEME